MLTYISHSPAETEAFACDLAKKLRPFDVLAFRGPMGMGKTAFVRGLAKGLGVRGEVASPTFAIVNEYYGHPSLYHFDMYRVNTMEDLYTTSFFDYLEHGGICAIEWSENIDAALPENTTFITLEQLGEEERKITVEGDERFA